MNALVKKTKGVWNLTVDGEHKGTYEDYVPGVIEAYELGATDFTVKYANITRVFEREGLFMTLIFKRHNENNQ